MATSITATIYTSAPERNITLTTIATIATATREMTRTLSAQETNTTMTASFCNMAEGNDWIWT